MVKTFNSFKIYVLGLVLSFRSKPTHTEIEGGGDVQNWLFRQPKTKVQNYIVSANQSSPNKATAKKTCCDNPSSNLRC